MIISASYKTDIPTFYGEWFMNRLRAGYCKTINPWNRKQISRIPLELDQVDGFIFWTKNIGPFVRHFAEIRDRGYHFVVQHTINGYPRELETSVVDADRAVHNVRSIAEHFGPRVCVWRYDTIVVSSLTPIDFHRSSFERLCAALEGAVDEVVVSFVQLYRKTVRNLGAAAARAGFSLDDPSDEQKRALMLELVQIASSRGVRLTVCSQPHLVVEGASDAKCIDAERLEAISGRGIRAERKGTRPDCACFASRDIGEYDTCPHGCIYCYAVQRRQLALQRFREHDPFSEFLFSPFGVADSITKPTEQRTLFE